MQGLFDQYETEGFFDEMFEADGKVLASADGIFSILQPDKMAALKAG